LIDSQRRMRLITDNLPALIAYVDGEQRYRFLSGQVHRLFGIDFEATLGRTMAEVRSAAAYAALAPHIEAALRGEAVSFTYADEIAGKPYRFQSNYVPDVDAAGMVKGFYAMTFDVSELHESQRQLEELARVDALTGLPNRRQFDERIREAMQRSRRALRSMALMFLDIDHFKTINDSLGHAAGDAVLREFARRLKASVRGTDVVARYAGDEFVIVFEGIDGVLDLKRVADKVVGAIRPRFQIGDSALGVTTSAGLAIYRGTDHTAADLIALADGALYQAKRQGRDRYTLA
jgi:diguanylate cyclase (GGDEF)-like protein/PAS domain S-box-containing protein